MTKLELIKMRQRACNFYRKRAGLPPKKWKRNEDPGSETSGWIRGGQIINIEPAISGLILPIARGAAQRLEKRLSTLKSHIYKWLGEMPEKKARKLFVKEVQSSMAGILATAVTEETIALTGTGVYVSTARLTKKDGEFLKGAIRKECLPLIYAFCRKNRIRSSSKNGWGL